MSELPTRGHFRYLSFKTFPMTSRPPQCEVFFPLLLSSEHSRVPEDSQPPTFPNVGASPPHLAKVGLRHYPPLEERGQCPRWYLEFSFAQLQLFHFGSLAICRLFAAWTLSQTNLGVPKIPTLSWQVQEGLVENPLPTLRQKTKLA
jgi:hypothetical protein